MAHTASNGRMTENNKLGMIYKQTTAFTKKLSQYLLEGNMKNYKKPQSG